MTEEMLCAGGSARTKVSLRRMSIHDRSQSYTPDTTIHVARSAHGSIPEYEFEEAWENLSPTSAKASGSVTLTITGAGFATNYTTSAYSSELPGSTEDFHIQYAVRQSFTKPTVC